jgi:hypothetical protein
MLDNYFSNPNMSNADYFASGMICVFLAITLFMLLTNTITMIHWSIYMKRRALLRGEIESLPRWIVALDKVTGKFSRKGTAAKQVQS